MISLPKTEFMCQWNLSYIDYQSVIDKINDVQQ